MNNDKLTVLYERLSHDDGNKIYDPKKRQYKCKSIPATDWNDQTRAEE